MNLEITLLLRKEREKGPPKHWGFGTLDGTAVYFWGGKLITQAKITGKADVNATAAGKLEKGYKVVIDPVIPLSPDLVIKRGKSK